MDAYENLMRRIAARRRTNKRLELMVDALELIRDNAGRDLGEPYGIADHSWCAGVAMAALAAIEEVK